MLDIIIPTFGKSTRLSITLTALEKCKDLAFIEKVIIIENGERLGAESICNKFAALNIKYIFQAKKGAVCARNAGIKESSAAHILFLDDDIELDEQSISAYMHGIKKYGPNCYFSGPLLPKYEVNPPSWLIEFLPWSAKNYTLGNAEKKIKHPGFLGGNICIPKHGVVAAGEYEGPGAIGTNAGGVGEETRLQERLLEIGFTAVWLPHAIGHHWIPVNRCDIKFTIQRAYRHGLTDAINDKNSYTQWFGAPRWTYRRLASEYVSLIISIIMNNDIRLITEKRIKTSKTRGMIAGYKNDK